MHKFILITIIALIITFLAIGLYAQEKDMVQTEPKIKLELVWEKDIPTGTNEIVFLDENGYNVFSSQCGNPEKAIKEKRILMIHDGKIKWLEGDEMRVVKEMPLAEGSSSQDSRAVISKNGRNIVVIEGLERYSLEEIAENKIQDKNPGDFKNLHATVRLLNWKGEELASTEIPIGGLEDVYLYPLGDDQTVVLNLVGDEGHYKGMRIFKKRNKVLQPIFNKDGAGIWDYSEDGQVMFCSIAGQGRVILDADFNEIGRFSYHPNRGNYWAGVSPKGNYIAEVTAGKYVVIHDRKGNLIKEHHVQGQGNYYAVFSPDEKYLCVTPGPWRVYFFETETGKMLWEYVDTLTRYRSIAVAPQGNNIFLSSTLYHPTNYSLQEMADKILVVFNHIGKVMSKNMVSSVKTPEELEFYRWEAVAPPLGITSDGRFLLVRLPNRLLLYHVVKGGGE